MQPEHRYIASLALVAACSADSPSEPTQAALTARVASVQFASDTTIMQMGVQLVVRPTLRDGAGVEVTGVPVTYTLSQEGVITVNDIGIATAQSVGSVALTATVNGKSGTTTVVTFPAVSTVLIAPNNVGLLIGQSVSLSTSFRSISGAPIDAPFPVTWSVEDSTILGVTAAGRITGRASGTTRVTATVGQASGSINVRVISESVIASITFGSAAYGMLVGQERQVSVAVRDAAGTTLALQPEWSSSMPGVGSISGTGRVTAQSAGETVIHARFGPVDATVPLTVFANATAGDLGAVVTDDQFVLVAAGTITRPVPQPDEMPPIEQDLTLPAPIRVQRTEVTQSQWLSVMPALPPGQSAGPCARCPVEEITPALATQFLAALNAAQPGRGYRLPTEAEWEYVARGGDLSLDFHGEIELVAWFAATMSGERPSQVALRRPNALGLYDVHGNVSELTAGNRFLRGGSWMNGAFFLTYHWRFDLLEVLFDTAEGLRLVRDP